MTEPDQGMAPSDLGASPDHGGDPDTGVPLDQGVPLDLGPPDAGRLADGAACTGAEECESRECVDGVCCDTACAGTCEACTAALTGGTNGTCSPILPDSDPDAECGVELCMVGLCDGAGACEQVADGTVCRASAGNCDVEESCAAGQCPADVVVDEGVVCRTSGGTCDVVEACDGALGTCPVDAAQPARTSVPACDPYTCSGGAACSTSCATDSDCAFGYFCVPGAPNTCVPGRLIFVTSTSHNGNLGGLSGADAICQARATAAGLSGTFRAWLSSGTLSAAQRIDQYTGPYYRFALPGTLRVASNWADLANGLDTAAIATDQNGMSAGSNTYAWTGTLVSGAADTSNSRCADWTSAAAAQTGTRGWTSAGSSNWTSFDALPCNASLRLYCVETEPPG